MEITIKDNKIELKKDYLTNVEVNMIVSEALKIYTDKEDKDIDGYDYNPLAMVTNFYAMLFELCIKDYSLNNVDDYNKYYNIGAHKELLEKITNASEAYELMMNLSKDLNNISNVIGKNLKEFIEKIPDKENISEALTQLPKEWQKVAGEYNNIIGKSEKKEDE